jgi:uncharacterized protein YecT (DUF1311 family)
MKQQFFTLLFCLANFFCFGQTQLDLNDKAHKDYLKADKELNSIYQKILNEYRSDTAFIKNFKQAQKIWVQFRDAEMSAKYPKREEGYYGSVQPMCWSMYLQKLTEERTKDIKIWLEGIEEGDVCAGSVKTKN